MLELPPDVPSAIVATATAPCVEQEGPLDAIRLIVVDRTSAMLALLDRRSTFAPERSHPAELIYELGMAVVA